ncbi:hypothetical protein [Sphingomonas sp. G-3-2-10]|uniref:hypothetical protein n=1 Tax=Sphingomonas sp. G-3-2-10 TaxID=2728838 RepID=UPI00146E82D1|nr:hypothetical protein [Sphingomonas sp. G-3-2-10]NML07594.1 hypothetical protein [Sphingomonas sp. G-3-2-10]
MLAMLLLIAVQDVPGPPADDAVAVEAPLTRQRCSRNADEIVVCGTAESPRLQALPEPETQRVFGPARVQLSPNKRAGLRAENSGNPTLSAPRMMLDFTIDF